MLYFNIVLMSQKSPFCHRHTISFISSILYCITIIWQLHWRHVRYMCYNFKFMENTCFSLGYERIFFLYFVHSKYVYNETNKNTIYFNLFQKPKVILLIIEDKLCYEFLMHHFYHSRVRSVVTATWQKKFLQNFFVKRKSCRFLI